MGGESSKHENTPQTHAARRAPSSPQFVYRRPPTPDQWREIIDPSSMDNTAKVLSGRLRKLTDTTLNIVLIGHTGAGKSSLINSLFAISRGRIANKASTKSVNLEGVGTYEFRRIKMRETDIFKGNIYDTIGFTGTFGPDDKGITFEDLKAICEGRIKNKHKFNEGTALTNANKKNRPHCIVFVVSASVIDTLSQDTDSIIRKKLMDLYKIVPGDVARMAVMTKADEVCDDTARDIRMIYRSKKVHGLVKKITSIFGVQENEVFPIVNYVNQSEFKLSHGAPIMYAILCALYFAADRHEDDDDSDDSENEKSRD